MMNDRSIIVIGLLFFIQLCLICVWWKIDDIEAALAERVSDIVKSEGAVVDSLSFSGRDGVLFATLESAAKRQALEAQLTTIEGVRSLDTDFTVLLPPVVEPPPQVQVDIAALLAETQIKFEQNSATLLDESTQLLEKIVSLLKEHSPELVEIAGHTDSTGNPERNIVLSRERATSVKDYLLEQGIDPQALRVEGYGSSRPKYPNATDLGRQRNRRVEFIVVEE